MNGQIIPSQPGQLALTAGWAGKKLRIKRNKSLEIETKSRSGNTPVLVTDISKNEPPWKIPTQGF